MDIQQVIASSPVRMLENMMAGGLGSGRLGVCMAHAGIGKTAFLIQIGIDASVRGKNVLHLALGQTTEHVQSWYETLLNDLLARCAVDGADEIIADATKHRVIQSFAKILAVRPLSPDNSIHGCMLSTRPTILDDFTFNR